jgi:hypothetical protein
MYKLLKDSIESVKQLRDELHDDIDSSKRKKLDRIIEDLESCEKRNISPNQILDLIGKALALLPLLEKVLDKFK